MERFEYITLRELDQIEREIDKLVREKMVASGCNYSRGLEVVSRDRRDLFAAKGRLQRRQSKVEVFAHDRATGRLLPLPDSNPEFVEQQQLDSAVAESMAASNLSYAEALRVVASTRPDLLRRARRGPAVKR